MSNYETIIIYCVKNGEEAAKELSEKFKAMMEKNGTVDSVDEWGKRRLAYLINDEEDGYYVLYNHACEPEFPAELERVLGITDGVLRSMVIKK
jgi:small subunit ribosomal protein S6